jgi:hypothetical protein
MEIIKHTQLSEGGWSVLDLFRGPHLFICSQTSDGLPTKAEKSKREERPGLAKVASASSLMRK